MTRHGERIESVGLRHAINPGIAYSMAFLEVEACVAAGLDLARWWLAEPEPYPAEFKATVIAWKQLHDQIGAHVQDAQVSKSMRGRK